MPRGPLKENDMECYFCKKQTDKLYELRGWDVCYDCYFEDIDKDLGKEDEGKEQALKEKP
jgi:hypothetical protein